MNFGLRLLDDPNSWTHRYTPFDFLSGILELEGHTASATWKTVTWSRFQVTPAFSAPLRKKVVAAILRLLAGDNRRAAFRAAKELGNAVRYSVGGDNREEWCAEFTETLQAVLALVRTGKNEPVVLLEIVRSVSWHAHYGDGTPAEVAKEIIGALPTTLEFLTTLACVDGYGLLRRRMGTDFAADRRELAAVRDALAEELIREFSSADTLRGFLDDVLSKIAEHDPDRQKLTARVSPCLASEVGWSGRSNSCRRAYAEVGSDCEVRALGARGLVGAPPRSGARPFRPDASVW